MAAIQKAIRDALAAAHHVLVVTHIGPDGDALGSLTAVGQALKQLGKQVTLVCDDGSLSRFKYLSMSERIQTERDAVDYDLLFAVDCGDESRMGMAFATLPDPKPFVINVDHHITNTLFGDINFVDPEATSTTEILYSLFADLGVSLTTDVAMSLLTGLVTDTLGFRTAGVTARTMKIASDLIDVGADLSLATQQGLTMQPYATLQMWRVGFNKMRMESRLVWTSISKEELGTINYTSSSSAGLVNMLADVEEAVMGVVLMEKRDGSIRVGFRCRPPYSVSELALNLGGGGHPLAAGCTLDGPLAQAESLVVDMCKEVIRQQSVNGR
ncbi:MAG: bifunctional oligoribonuclease/PAP phosphatase NrnA [Anaerolineales bacterium]|nr:bifunctional oligoribonuclease/PAP phosphatase NrnA [Anaerolineales bacterium]